MQWLYINQPEAAASGHSLCQRELTGPDASDGKFNGIQAILELHDLANIQKKMATIDAVDCQKENAAQIRQQNEHFVPGLKGISSTSQADIQAFFDGAAEDDDDLSGANACSTSEQGHGREDERIVLVIPIPQDHPSRKLWADLQALVAVTIRREQQQREHGEARFDVSSQKAKTKLLAEVICRPRSIENRQHCILDVAFGSGSRRQSDCLWCSEPGCHSPTDPESAAPGVSDQSRSEVQTPGVCTQFRRSP